MNINVLHMMVGLPRSGKSTVSKEMGFPIVEPDAIRLAMHGTLWNAEVEPLIWGFAHTMVRSLFLAGHTNVILDATNHTNERRKMWQDNLWVVKYHLVDTCEEICIQRSKDTERDYLIPIIKRMASNFEHPNASSDC